MSHRMFRKSFAKAVAGGGSAAGPSTLTKALLTLLCLLSLTPAAAAQKELTFDGWKWPASSDGITYIPVCWENPGFFATERGWVRQAIRDTWEDAANLSFQGWGTCGGGSPGIRILIEDVRAHSLVGYRMSGVPEGMSLNFTFDKFSKDYCQRNREHCIKSVAVHEFGHALGFIHEQDRPDSICYEGRKPNGRAGLLTPFDVDSVMNYCNRKWNNGGFLSAYDIEGVQRVYGRKNSVARGVISVTDELGEGQVAERVTMTLRGASESEGTTQVFSLSGLDRKETKSWNFNGSGVYHYHVESVTRMSDGRLVRGYVEGRWTLAAGDHWDLTLYTDGWNPSGYMNLVLKGSRRGR